MKRILLYTSLVLAALVPAAIGLWGNASFSQDIPVRVPDSARSGSPSVRPESSPGPGLTASPPATPTTHDERADRDDDRSGRGRSGRDGDSSGRGSGGTSGSDSGGDSGRDSGGDRGSGGHGSGD